MYSRDDEKQEESIPYLFELLESDKELLEALCFYLVGCFGTGDENQDAVLDLMLERIAKDNPRFLVALGDLAYNPAMLKKILDKLKKLGIPIFRVWGNHDVGLYREHNQYGEIDQSSVKDLNDYFYTNKNGELDKDKEDVFKQKGFSVSELRKFFNPFCSPENPYYAIHSKKRNKIFLFLDSNTLVQHYRLWSKNPKNSKPSSKINQFSWLLQILKKYPNAEYIVFQHHPIFTFDKRVRKSDAKFYLHPDVEKALQDDKKDPIAGNYNQKLAGVFRLLERETGSHLRIFYGAHSHHNLRYVDNSNPKQLRRQLIFGGGGGKLQPIEDYTRFGQMTGLENFGFGKVRIGENIIRDEIFTINNHHLRFENFDIKPKIENSDEHPVLKTLRAGINKACDKYLTDLKKALEPHGFKGFLNACARVVTEKASQGNTREILGGLSKVLENVVDLKSYLPRSSIYRAFDLKNYFNCYHTLELKAAVNYIKEVLATKNQWKHPDEFSLSTLIEKEVGNLDNLLLAVSRPRTQPININLPRKKSYDENKKYESPVLVSSGSKSIYVNEETKRFDSPVLSGFISKPASLSEFSMLGNSGLGNSGISILGKSPCSTELVLNSESQIANTPKTPFSFSTSTS